MTDTNTRLMKLAIKRTGLTEDQIIAAIDDPQWSERGKVHDWRNHESEEEWAEINRKAMPAATIREIARYLRETGKAQT